MIVPPAPAALGESARTALLAALLAVVVGVLIAWVVASTGHRRRRHHALHPQAPAVPAAMHPMRLPEPIGPLAPPREVAHSQLTPYVNGASAEKLGPPVPPVPLDPNAIHLNRASYEELRKVDGIDPVQAARILAYRRTNGDFESLDELRRLTGLEFEQLESSDGRRVVL
jgi:hypothetical protein